MFSEKMCHLNDPVKSYADFVKIGGEMRFWRLLDDRANTRREENDESVSKNMQQFPAGYMWHHLAIEFNEITSDK